MMKLSSKNSNLCDHNSPTLQTDRQTDRQTTCDRNTALCTKVHRAVIKASVCYTTVALPYCCRLSSTRIFVVSYGRLTKSSDEMSTKNSRILILVLVNEKNTGAQKGRNWQGNPPIPPSFPAGDLNHLLTLYARALANNRQSSFVNALHCVQNY